MKVENTTSEVIKLLNLVWDNANSATSFSYERLNHSMRYALKLAIGSGFEFQLDDICTIFNHYRSGYWIGESDEWIYGEAVAGGNMSAIKSYEHSAGREPIIADDVSPARVLGNGYLHGNPSRRKRERLAVGSEFTYQGLRLRVNSFASDSSYINCGYYENGTLKKRFKITPADIKADRAYRKSKAKK